MVLAGEFLGPSQSPPLRSPRNNNSERTEKMLETYKNLTARGVIGPLMKVGPDGKQIVDPTGDLPGTLVQRPFAEYPKAVRRVRTLPDGTEQTITLVAGSKAEELKIMSDTVEMDVPRSPLERERDELATELATQSKMNGQLATQLENALARIQQLADKIEKLTAEPVVEPAKEAAKPAASSGIAALAEQRALQNKK
jgi:hypothetical protein